MTRFYYNAPYSSGSYKVYSKFLFLLVSLFSIGGVLLTSCEEDPTLIGKDLLPGTDFVNTVAENSIVPASFTMYDQEVSTNNPVISYLGTTWDPYFGTTSTSFVSQLRLSQDWNFGEYIIDSVFLFIKLEDVKGGSAGTHILNIKEIDSELKLDEKYYSNTVVPYAPFSLDIPLPALKEDSVNLLQVKLPDLKFAERILQDTSKLFHSNKIPDFRSYFKGLHFSLSSIGDPALVSVDLAHANEGYFIGNRRYKNFFVIYIHNSAGSVGTIHLILDAVNTNVAFNLFAHDFGTAEPGKQIENYNNSDQRDTLTYVQSLNGLYTRITLPGLKALKESGNLNAVAVNKARLTVPFYSDNDHFKDADVPARLFLRYRTVSETKPIVPDYNLDEFHTFYDGRADTIRHAYTFNIGTFVQQYLEDSSGDILPELEIVQAAGIQNLILKANGSSTPLIFEFTYTKF
jgi:hypothetical protein